MTICAGFKSMFGVVLCADSQETVGSMKFSAPKLCIKPSVGEATDTVRMMFAGAGDGPFIDKLVEKMWTAARNGPGMSQEEVFERVEDANIEWHKKIWGVYAGRDRPEAEILIAIYTRHKVCLYKATGPIISPVFDHAFVGIGGELGSFLAEHLSSGIDTLQGDVSTCLYILENAKKYVDGCGGDTQIAAMTLDGGITKMSPYYAGRMAAGVSSIGQNIYYLFSSAINLEETKTQIDQAVRSSMREIHRDRAKLRKEVKERIIVPPEVVEAVEMLYQRIEWPPIE